MSVCLEKVIILEPKKRKLGLKTFDAAFIGYAEDSATYSFLSSNQKMT